MQQAGRWIGGDPMNDSRNLSGPVLMPGATAAAMKYAKSASSAPLPMPNNECPFSVAKVIN